MGTVILWLLVAIAVIILDIATSTFLFSFISIGALAAIIATVCGVDFTIQFVLFAIISVISIGIGYPVVKKKFNKDIARIPLMEESYIGQTFLAEEDIIDLARIKVGGIYWTGVNRGKKITKGEHFKIIGIEGNKFIICESKEEE